MRFPATTGTQFHVPVMLKEVVDILKISPDGTYLDGTIGTGGHAALILKKLSKKGCLIGIDRDEEALRICKKSLSFAKAPYYLFNNCYTNFEKISKQLGITQMNGIILDFPFLNIHISKRQIKPRIKNSITKETWE